MNEIDPFTFLCYIHKYGDKRRLNYLQQIAEKLNIKTTWSSRYTYFTTSKGLVSFQYLRTNNEVARLWSLLKRAKGEVADEDFADVLKIKNVGDAKLTEVLFYINPRSIFQSITKTIHKRSVRPEYKVYILQRIY